METKYVAGNFKEQEEILVTLPQKTFAVFTYFANIIDG